MQPWRQMRASLILLFGKTKALFGKDAAQKKLRFCIRYFLENERETSEPKRGLCFFFYEIEGHIAKIELIWMSKTIYGLKSHLG